MQRNPTFKTGTWTSEEDGRLRTAVSRHGNKWTLVATEVMTRNGDQCAKRWNEKLNPELDHSPWSSMEDKLLLHLVHVYGRNWKFLASNHLELRAPLALKNRHSLLMRRAKREVTAKKTQAMMLAPPDYQNLLTPAENADQWVTQPDDQLLEPADEVAMTHSNSPTVSLANVMRWDAQGPELSFPQASLPSPSSSALGIHADQSASASFDFLFGGSGGEPARPSAIETKGNSPDQPLVTEVFRTTETVNYSVTCSRRNIRSRVYSIVDTALSDIAAGDDDSVTLSVGVQS